MAAWICFRSEGVSFFVADNVGYLLIQSCLPCKHGIVVVRLIRTLLRSEEANANDVAENNLQWLTILLVHGQQECWQHDNDHCHGGNTCSGESFDQKEQRYANQRAATETYELPFCEIK